MGAYALAYHGAPRYTGDLDIFVHPSPENAVRVLAALTDFGFGSVGLTIDDFTALDRVVQLGYPPVRVDLMTEISGVSWVEAIEGSVPGEFGDVPIRYIGRDQFVVNKLATGRRKDMADLEALGIEPGPMT